MAVCPRSGGGLLCGELAGQAGREDDVKMARRESFTCDICGKEKQDVNHWFVFNDAAYSGDELGIAVFQWHEPLSGYQHLCGQECVIKAVSKWMQNLTKPA